MIISRWDSDFNAGPSYSAIAQTAFGAPGFNPGGSVGYELIGNPAFTDLVPVQLPNPAINDLEVSTVNLTMGMVLQQSAGGVPGPGSISGVVGTLMQNNLPFLSMPMAFSAWGFVGTVSGFLFQGSLTPTTPFPIYQSDRFQLIFTFQLTQPIPQSGGGAAPATGSITFRMLDITEAQALGIGPSYGSKATLIGTQTPKESLF